MCTWQGSIMHMSESTLGSQERVWNPLAQYLLIPWLWVTQLVLIGEPESPERAANAFNWWICNLFTIFSWSDIMMPLACVCEEFFVPSPQDHFVFKEHFYMLRISSMYTMCSDHVQPSFLSPNSPRHLHRAPAPPSTAPFVLNPTTPYLVLFACT